MKRLKTLVNLFVKGEISSERKSYLSLSAIFASQKWLLDRCRDRALFDSSERLEKKFSAFPPRQIAWIGRGTTRVDSMACLSLAAILLRKNGCSIAVAIERYLTRRKGLRINSQPFLLVKQH
jgi:hypothetical protein